MKYLFIVLLVGCSYNDCIVNVRIVAINNQLAIENQYMAKILKQEWTQDIAEQVAQEMDVIESLEIERLALQNQNCK